VGSLTCFYLNNFSLPSLICVVAIHMHAFISRVHPSSWVGICSFPDSSRNCKIHYMYHLHWQDVFSKIGNNHTGCHSITKKNVGHMIQHMGRPHVASGLHVENSWFEGSVTRIWALLCWKVLSLICNNAFKLVISRVSSFPMLHKKKGK
jgi:hypothetical protein